MIKIKDKQLYKMIITIAIPVALQNMLAFLTQMIDTIMLGELGDVPLSASALANQVFFVFSLFIFGMAGGAAVITAQYWGKKQILPIKVVMATTLRVVGIVGFIVSVLTLLFPQVIMGIFSTDQEVIEAGVEYLSIIGYVYFIFGISNMLSSLFRSVEMVKVAVISNSISLVTNCFLNWVLIFGNLGAPRLEILGAAYATLIAKIVELIFVLVYVFILDKKLRFKLKDMLLRDENLSADLLKYCSPVVANELVWSFGIALQNMVFGRLSSFAISAVSIANVLQQLSTVFIFGVAASAAVIVGKTIGEGDMELARKRGRKLEIFSVILGVVAMSIMLILRNPFVDFYNVSPETAALAKEMVVALAITVFFVAIAGICIVGVLRGGGDTKFTLVLDVICLWFVSIPLGLLCAYVFKLPIIVIYAVFKLDEVAKAIMCIWRLAGTKWLRNVTRDDIATS